MGLLGAVLFALALAVPSAALADQTLTVEKSGSGTGTVTSSPTGIDCGTICSTAFPDNASVLLSAIAGPNSAAVKWTDCDQVTIENKCKVSMSGARTVNASFALVKRKLVVEAKGSGTGTVTSSPTGIECATGSACGFEYDHGTEVTLTGAPGPFTEAVKWTGCDSLDSEGRCRVTMSGAKSVGATFNLRPRTLTINKGGLGSGTVASKPAGISCGGTCSFAFGEGQTITLTGTPSGGAEAVKWSGCDSIVEGKCLVTMSGPREVGAVFDVEGPTLTVLRLGNGAGTVTSSPAGLDCGAACAVNFPQGQSVVLKGDSGLHTQPVKWAGCDEVLKEGKCLVTMSSAREVGAVFALEPQWSEFLVSIRTLGTGAGTVTSLPTGIQCPSDCSEQYLLDTSLTLFATPEPGSQFDHWSVGSCGAAPICTLGVRNSREIHAVFDAVGKRTLTVAKAGTGSGTVVSKPAGIECGSTCTAEVDAPARVVLKATPAAGSKFTGWSGEGCAGKRNCRVQMNQARSVTASFAREAGPGQGHCVVPRLVGKTLSRARAALANANCSLGRIRKPKGARLSQLRVRSASSPAGTTLAAGAKVSLRLGRPRR